MGRACSTARPGAFSLVNLCNHWTARRLGEAGLPVWHAAATWPGMFLFDLDMRAGLPASVAH